MDFPAGLDPEAPSGAIALMVLGTTTPFPAEVSALAVAMMHDFWSGFALIWSGAMAGAAISYLAAIWLAERAHWLRRLNAVRAAEARLKDLGWLGILGLRLIPLVPFFALSLAAGLLRVPPRAYFQGTAVGIVPASAILTLLGRGLISERAGVVVASALALIAIAGLFVLIRRWNRRSP